ncbi:MAG: hypothetical protein LBF00_02135, partial [Mycoplasmataceae bacterium]|nr:hypothetical protein [Mycoplasmataceae bacterium]
MVIIEVEHGILCRRFQIHKSTEKDHICFLNDAKQYYRNEHGIEIVSIQMDNAPEYAKSHNSYEKIVR